MTISAEKPTRKVADLIPFLRRILGQYTVDGKVPIPLTSDLTVIAEGATFRLPEHMGDKARAVPAAESVRAVDREERERGAERGRIVRAAYAAHVAATAGIKITSKVSAAPGGSYANLLRIVVAGAATGAHGSEGTILRRVFWHSLALAALVGVWVLLQAYVYPFTRLVIR